MKQLIHDWFLVAASTCLVILFVVYATFQISYIFLPILDTQGSNFDNMQVNQKVYHPGDMIIVRFKFQKQRVVAGTIKWSLKDHSWEYSFPSRLACAYAPQIYDVWAAEEIVPLNTPPGRYHLEGSITYPLPSFWFLRQQISYPIRTEEFEVQ